MASKVAIVVQNSLRDIVTSRSVSISGSTNFKYVVNKTEVASWNILFGSTLCIAGADLQSWHFHPGHGDTNISFELKLI